MSVYIPGMEMPQRCRDCCFAGFVFTCHLTGKTHNDVLRTRPDWCPLVEIKTPHGRLTDADALHELFMEYAKTSEDKSASWAFLFCANVIKIVKPIADAEGATE